MVGGTQFMGWGVPQPGLDGGGYPIPEVGVPQPGLDGGGYPIHGVGGTPARSEW